MYDENVQKSSLICCVGIRLSATRFPSVVVAGDSRVVRSFKGMWRGGMREEDDDEEDGEKEEEWERKKNTEPSSGGEDNKKAAEVHLCHRGTEARSYCRVSAPGGF